MAKIAVEFESVSGYANGHVPGRPARRVLARGDGWSVSDVVCSAGPRDRPFEEQYSNVCVAIVMAGSFQYRSSAGREVMTPGSLLLGNAGQYFECGHEHGVGDRCISFSYERRYFEGIADEAGLWSRSAHFSTLRIPPVRGLSSLVARAVAGLAESGATAPGHEQSIFIREAKKQARNYVEHASASNAGNAKWEEIGVELAHQALEISSDGKPSRRNLPAAEARVTRIVRMIEGRPDLDLSLGSLAREVKLSRYHFLRVFQHLTGLTPHRYIVRAKLRRAATRLMLEPAKVLDIAFDSGFGDVSNFNRAFRGEFGVSPRSYRRNARPHQ
ncbi:MAG TPA: AraC family transcriptional regulator [Candidatus Acidoferrum sp.]